MTCPKCGADRPALARFCGHCGQTLPEQGVAVAVGRPASTRRAQAGAAMTCAGLLLGGEGLPAWIVLPVVAIEVAAAVDAFAPQWYATRSPAWARRPRLAWTAATVAVVIAVMHAGSFFPGLLICAGSVFYAADAATRGDLGRFTGIVALKSWQSLVIVGVFFAALSFGTDWVGASNAGYSQYTPDGNGQFVSSTVSGASGYASNDTPWAQVFLLTALLVVAYRPRQITRQRLRVLIPLLVAAGLAIWGIMKIIADSNAVAQYNSAQVSSIYLSQDQAVGPWMFTLGVIVMGVGALIMALRSAQLLPAPDA